MNKNDVLGRRIGLTGTMMLTAALGAACGGDDEPAGPVVPATIGSGGATSSTGGAGAGGEPSTTSTGGAGTGGDPSGGAGGVGGMGGIGGMGGMGEGGEGGVGGDGGAPMFCAPQSTQSCYEGPLGTDGVGVCAAGLQTCAMDGSAFGACEDQTLPGIEDCYVTGDENCDGIACSETVWADSYTGTSVVAYQDHVVDANGNIYLALYHDGSLSIGNFTVADAGNRQSAIVKLDSAGAVQWVKSFGGAGADTIRALALRGSNVVAVGDTTGAINFGPTTATTIDPVNTGAFVAELDPMGTHLWSRSLDAIGTLQPASGNRFASDVAVDGSGRIWVVGHASGHFGCGISCPTFVGDAGYVRALEGTGAIVASRFYEGPGNQRVTAVAGDPLGVGAVVAGRSQDDVDLGGGSTFNHVGTSYDGFLVRIGSDTTPTWSLALGVAGSGSQVTDDVEWVGSRILVAGYSLGAYVVGGLQLATSATEGGMLFEVTNQGILTWARLTGDAGALVNVRDVAVDAGGNVVVAMRVEGTGVLDAVTYGGAANAEGVVAKLDAAGAPLWLREFAGTDNANVSGLAIMPGDVIAAAGNFVGTLDVGTGPLVATANNVALWTLQP